MDFSVPKKIMDVSLPEKTMDVSKILSSSQTKVALTLMKHVLQDKARKNSNAVLSPLSIQAVLSVIAAGSNGSTLDQVLRFLDSSSNDQLSHFFSEIVSHVFNDGSRLGGPRLSFANSVWIDESLPLKQAFKQILQDVYKAASNQVDFQTQAIREQVISEVNSWAEKETNGLIKQVVGPNSFDDKTKLIFANALYFKGVWVEKFNDRSTKDYDFYLTDGSSVKASFVTSRKSQYIRVFNGFKVLGLPYKQGRIVDRKFSMYIFLPDAVDGLEALVEKVSCESDFLERHVPRFTVPVGEFRFPKFKMSSELDARQVLEGLGLVLPFSEDEADFTKMAALRDDETLYVSGIFHKSFIEVNEEGTEAAAFTMATFSGAPTCCGPQARVNFVADHPFLFMIRENVSGVVLFTGHVINPLLN